MRVRTGTRDAVISDVVEQLRHQVTTAVRTRGLCVLAIPGGSVADTILPPFSLVELPWSQIHLFWVDERVVPTESLDSNTGAALRRIADSPMAQHAHFHPMTDTFRDALLSELPHHPDPLHTAAEAYARTLQATAGTPPVLDVALLGVGADGHVASLFPGTRWLDETMEPVVVDYAAPKPPPRRLSLSAPVLVRARHVIVVAFGETKAGAMRDALENPSIVTPVAHVLRNAQDVTVNLDHAAASRLTSTPQEQLG